MMDDDVCRKVSAAIAAQAAAAAEEAAVQELAGELSELFEETALTLTCPACGTGAGEWCNGTGPADTRLICTARWDAWRAQLRASGDEPGAAGRDDQ